MNLRTQLLCVSFSLSCWEGRRQDKKVSREVADKHGTTADVGRYHKDLLPGALEHQNVLSLRNAWRVWSYGQTLPWGEDGARVLRSEAFLDYCAGFRSFQDQWTASLDVFYDAYPQLVARSEMRLNSLFNRADYPTLPELQRRFAVRLNTYPLPNADDFRIIEGISPNEAERLRVQAVEGIEAQVTDAMKDLWSRMHKVVTAMQERLSVPAGTAGGKFKDSLVGNIEELLDVVPRLNLTNDTEIALMADEMRLLCGHQPDTLRQDPDVRSETAQKAAALAARMKCYVDG